MKLSNIFEQFVNWFVLLLFFIFLFLTFHGVLFFYMRHKPFLYQSLRQILLIEYFVMELFLYIYLYKVHFKLAVIII